MLVLEELIGMPEDPVRVEVLLECSVVSVGRLDVQTGHPEVQRLSATTTWDLGASRPPDLHGIYLSRFPCCFNILGISSC